jgi:hypothetical protein
MSSNITATPLTTDIIAIISDASKGEEGFADALREILSTGGSGGLQAHFLIAAMNTGEGAPPLHRLITLKALVHCVDWDEVAAFFSSIDSDSSDSTTTEEN